MLKGYEMIWRVFIVAHNRSFRITGESMMVESALQSTPLVSQGGIRIFEYFDFQRGKKKDLDRSAFSLAYYYL